MSQRNTGRTTRMLEEAKRLCSEGREVYIIVANEYERLRIRKLLHDNPGISVETSYYPGNFDWDAMQLRGTNRNCVTLIDHYAIELRFANVLRELHRFDLPAERECGT